jgi:hypothetical protein
MELSARKILPGKNLLQGVRLCRCGAPDGLGLEGWVEKF